MKGFPYESRLYDIELLSESGVMYLTLSPRPMNRQYSTLAGTKTSSRLVYAALNSFPDSRVNQTQT